MPWQRKADAPYVVVTDAGLWALALIRFPFLQYLAPTLGGETIDVTTFCAAGPAYDPPVTMADIVWLGIPPAGRPWTLLGVTREIARQELFAKYCENPDLAGSAWHTYDVNPLCVDRVAEVWNSVMYLGPTDLPLGTSRMRFTQLSGVTHQVYTGLADPTLSLSVGYDDQGGVAKTGLGNTDPATGGYFEFACDTWLAAHPHARPHLVARDGYHAPPDNHWCLHIEYFAPSSGDYVPPAVWQDPNVQLPSGTGATLDQLEAKLDVLMEDHWRTPANRFALDPTTLTGTAAEVTGELLDATGCLIQLVGLPGWASQWVGDPSRYRELATITFGNLDGWWPAISLEHAQTVILPSPLGATRFSLRCIPPVTGAVALYRPTT